MSAIDSFKTRLSQDPTQWELYKELAAFQSSPAEKSHILLKGAWHALEKGIFKIAGDLAKAAHTYDGSIFSAFLIDIEILRKQGCEDQIPKKLAEIASIFEKTGLPRQAVKAYKRLALLDPTQDHYKTVIALYEEIGKKEKAAQWEESLSCLSTSKSVEKEAPSLPKTSELNQSIVVPASEPSSNSKKASSSSETALSKASAIPSVTSSSAPKIPKPTSPQMPSRNSKEASSSGITISTPSLPVNLPPAKPKLPDIAFGKARWAEFFGDVGEEPPLPPNIAQVLAKLTAPAMLVLVPKTVNGQSLDLLCLYDLVKKPRKGKPTSLEFTYTIDSNNGVSLVRYKEHVVTKSHWVLMSYKVAQDHNHYNSNDYDRNKPPKNQSTLLAPYRKKTGLPWKLPTVIDAAVCLLMEYFRKGEEWKNKWPNSATWDYATSATYCQFYDRFSFITVVGLCHEKLRIYHPEWSSFHEKVRGQWTGEWTYSGTGIGCGFAINFEENDGLCTMI